jgi:hypothetical protein
MLSTRLIVTGLLAVSLATPAAAQSIDSERGFFLRATGGAYGHTRNLNDASSSFLQAHFEAGYVLGLNAGVQLNRFVRVNSDFALIRTKGKGAFLVDEVMFNRYVYGAQVEARLPLKIGIAPFVSAGAGGITIEDRYWDDSFTKPAATFGLGVGYDISSQGELMLAAKRLPRV